MRKSVWSPNGQWAHALSLLAAGLMALMFAWQLRAQTSVPQTRNNVNRDVPPTITVREAIELINLLPAVKELRTKGTVVRSDVSSVPDMNNEDYYLFWVYVPKSKEQNTGATSVGNYAVNRHTADVRVWEVSAEVFFGNDGALVTSDELEQFQKELRTKYGIGPTLVQKYRPAHLAAQIIPRDQAQSAAVLPVTERSANTAELSCWKGNSFGSRFARSAVISSSAGARAYAEVQATALKPKYQETYSGPLCENSIKLFLASAHTSSFRVFIDTKDCSAVADGDFCNANGVQLVDWSRDGNLLLAETVSWQYESDSRLLRVPIVYDVAKRRFTRPDVYHLFDTYYKTDSYEEKEDPASTHCDYELLTEGFSPEGNVVLSASRPPLSDTYEPVFCFAGKQKFLFDLASKAIKPVPSDYSVEHYATRESGGPKPR
jgi:hypothetical protein